ncbi:MAG: hypothetical protein AAF682_14105 [Planctomycetota bacterium]
MKALLLLSPLLAGPVTAQQSHTRYELGEPGSGLFRIVYDVTATEAGATSYLNPIRTGAEVSDVAVTDLASGAELAVEQVEGDDGGTFLKVELPRPVPTVGGCRLRIDKTYRDAASYTYAEEAGELIFDRSLGIKRNRVVLPAGFELVGCNVPSQVLEEADGRIAVSFLNDFPAAAPLRVRARLRLERVLGEARELAPEHLIQGPPPPRAPASPELGGPFAVPAANTRDIVYFLRQPETHAFRLYHDYTEVRTGVGQYLNVVRPGSSVDDPEALNLDTGEELAVETLRGEAIAAAGIELGAPPTPETQVVVIRFPAVEEGGSTRLRITETYTDAARYGLLSADELVWSRTFGRSSNAVVLPPGWYLTASALPVAVTEMDDGRIRLQLTNDRPDQLATWIRARRR